MTVDRERVTLDTLRAVLTYHQAKSQIVALKNHKGTLAVIWDSPPGADERGLTAKMWNLFYENEVSHFVLSDAGGDVGFGLRHLLEGMIS